MCQCGLHAVLWWDIGTYASPRCSTSQGHRTFIPLSVSLWDELASPELEGMGLAGDKSRANAFLLALAALSVLYTHKNLRVKITHNHSFFYLASNDAQSCVKALETCE